MTKLRPEATDRPLWLYGNGKLGALARDYFAAVGQEVAGTFEHDEDAPRDARVAVAIVTAPYSRIEARLRSRGFIDVWPAYDIMQLYNGHPLRNGWYANPITDNDDEKISEVHAAWYDDISRAHYLQFLAWRLLRQELIFEDIPAPILATQHFIPEVVDLLHDNETYLDGGAYIGETVRRFRGNRGGMYKQIIAFEPDSKNFAALVDWFPLCSKRIALSDKTGSASFYDGYGICSRLGDGPAQVPTWQIDDLYLKPSLIKLHLEGGELAALKGAKRTLRQYRPIISANVDHNDDGMWRTAHWLMSTLEDYEFLFRNHVWCAANSIVYAIPKERK